MANIALRGFVLDFVSSDHHINIVEVTTDFAGTEGEIVHFLVNCQYADRNFDDEFSGHVDVLVIADLQDDDGARRMGDTASHRALAGRSLPAAAIEALPDAWNGVDLIVGAPRWAAGGSRGEHGGKTHLARGTGATRQAA